MNILSSIQNILKSKDIAVNEFGNRPETLTNQDLPLIKTNYVASIKADGLRSFLYYCGDTYSILNPFIIKKLGKFANNVGKNANINATTLANSKTNNIYLLDCEYITELDEYYVFDILIHKGVDVTSRYLIDRIKLITPDLLAPNIKMKEIYNLENNENIYQISKKIYGAKYPYGIDGIIYTPIYEPYKNKSIYKWKPIIQQTVDFLIREIGSVTKNGKTTKTFSLFVARNDKNIISKLVRDATYMRMFPFVKSTDKSAPAYFTPAPTVEIEIAEHTIDGNKYGNNKNILIKDNTIVEFYYDIVNKKWVPHRYRQDKMPQYLENFFNRKFVSGKGPNSWRTADDVFKYLKNPIEDAMLFGNKEIPSTYYLDIKKPGLDMNLYDYNRVHIKGGLYRKYLKKGDKVLDLAGGRGGDIHTMRDSKYILHIDIANDVLKEAKSRYNKIKTNLQMDFLKFNLLGNDANKITQVKRMRNTDTFDLISCHFAFHYFCKSRENIEYVIDIISKNLRKGGVFIMTGYDGRAIYDAMKDTPTLEYTYKDTVFAKLIKKYKETTFKDCGQTINVYIEKIAIPQDEYLMNFKYINEVFKKHGMAAIENHNFTYLLPNYGKYLTDNEKEYINLHRYSIYKKL